MKKHPPIRRHTLKETIIKAKLQNPNVSLKIIAKNECASYNYTRKVWSKYQRNIITNKGGALRSLTPFPFQVQDQGYALDGPPYWYRDCPLEASTNRNGQKVQKTPYYSIVFNKRGSVQLYVYHVDWEKKLREWLSGWMVHDDLGVFFDYLTDRGGKHYAVDAPGVPKGYKFTVPGIGSFATDGTPYKKGTMEFEVDPGFDKRLAGIESAIWGQNKVMEVFSKAMTEHVTLVKSLQEVAHAQEKTTKQFGEAIREIVDMVKEMRK